MLKKIRKSGTTQYKMEKVRRIAIRTGVAVIVLLFLLCYIEIRKETIAAACYEKTLYQATAQARWLKYGQYEPETLYWRTIDRIPVFHQIRLKALRDGVITLEATGDNRDRYSESDRNDVANQPDADTLMEKSEEENKQGSLLVRYVYGTVQPLPKGTVNTQGKLQSKEEITDIRRNSIATILSTVREQYRWKEAAEQARFLKNYYIADVSVGNVSSVINGEKLLTADTSLERITEEPQILVYHTHGTEKYKNSREGVEADTVIGMGDLLCEELSAKGFSVLHDRTTYDFVNGKDNRDYAYTTARPQIESLLKEYPSIEVVLDIHRDSGAARTTTIEGKNTAQIMLFNGLCRNADGPISYLPNPYMDDILAFSLQLNLLGRERYPGLMYKIYLKNYRYNMHFTGHCMLVELGTQNNTVEEAQNGIRYLADLLYELLTEK